MSAKPTSKTSRTDWKRVRAMRDRDIKIDRTHPELDLKHVVRTIVRDGLKVRSVKEAASRGPVKAKA
jgi:hypothetical protein